MDRAELLAYFRARVIAPNSALELRRIDEVVATSDHWEHLERSLAHSVMSWLVARLQTLQQSHSYRPDELYVRFGRLTRISGRLQPGHVRGLRPEDVPIKPKWSEDAAGWQRWVLDPLPLE